MSALATAVVALGIAAYSALPSVGMTSSQGHERPALLVSGAGRPLLQASAMSPGARVRRTVSVQNRGTRDGVLSLRIEVDESLHADHALGDVLRAEVSEEHGRVLASTPVSRFGSRSLLRLRAGEARELTVALRLPDRIDDRLSNGRTGFDLIWTLGS